MSDPLVIERGDSARSSRLDVYAFFTAFIVGLASYFLLHLTVRSQTLETLAIVVCMFAYAIGVSRVPRLRVRLDQAGDNAYYLGLLFTLTSMAFALYEFRGASLTDAGVSGRAGAEQIISNFGIALASTICGIFLRVVLHQMRVDPADVEGMTRIELAEASRRVKANLDAVSTDLALFQAQSAQRMNDVIASASTDFLTALNAFTDKVTAATGKLLAETASAQQQVVTRAGAVTEKLDVVAENARLTLERLRAVEPLPQGLVQRLQQVCSTLEQLDKPVGSLNGAFQDTMQAAAKVVAQLTTTADQLTELGRLNRDEQAFTLRTIADAAHGFRKALEDAGSALQQDKALLREREEQSREVAVVAQQTHDMAKEALASLAAATRELTAAVRAAAASADQSRRT